MALLMALLGTLTAHADSAPYNQHKMKFGIVHQKYWLAGSAVANNEAAVRDGVAAWNASATPASWSRTNVKADSHLDWYNIAASDGNCAVTKLYGYRVRSL